MQQHWNRRRRLRECPQDGQQERHQKPALFTSFHGLLTFSQILTCFSFSCDNDREQKALVPHDYEKPTAHALDACFAHMRQLFLSEQLFIPDKLQGTHDSRELSERSLALSVVDRSSAAHASRAVCSTWEAFSASEPLVVETHSETVYPLQPPVLPVRLTPAGPVLASLPFIQI